MNDFTEPPNELFVVGEHADDPTQLLLQGTDGNYYAYEPSDGHPHPVEPGDDWTFETSPDDDFIL